MSYSQVPNSSTFGNDEESCCTECLRNQIRSNWVCWTLFILCSILGIAKLVDVFSASPKLPFYGEQRLSISPMYALEEPFKEPLKNGQILHLYGNTTSNAEQFCLALGKPDTLALKFCAIFIGKKSSNASTTYECMANNGSMIKETSVNPFEKDKVFDLRIRVLEKFVQIFANQGEIGVFEKSKHLENALATKLSGDLRSLRIFRREGQKYELPFKSQVSFGKGVRLDISGQPIMRLTSESQIAEIFDEDKNTTKTKRETVEIDQNGTDLEALRVKRRSSGGGGRGGSRGSSSSRSSSRFSFSSRSSSSGSRSSWSSGRSRGWSASRTGSRFSGSSSSGRSFYRHNTRYYGSSDHYYGPSSYSYIFGGRTYYRSSTSCYSCRKRYTKEKPIPRSKFINMTFYDARDTVAFQITVRFVEEAVVMNTFYQGHWEKEKRGRGVPIDDWKIFDLTILNKPEYLAIYFNGELFHKFARRESTWDLRSLMVDGDLELHSITTDGQLVTGKT